MNEQIANNIRNKRLELGYKQEVLALECNMTQANISHIEKGKVKPSEEKLEKIAQTLGTTPEELKYGVTIEHKNETNSNNQSRNGIFYEDFEKERQQWKTIEQAKDDTINSQKITIALLQAEIDRLKNQTQF
jgi:transcriptional regulator with XRE-family HTH domain